MLFQGQEFAASAPFLYFADHNPELSKLVAEGRKAFLSQFSGIANRESWLHLTLPHAEETFARCKLDFSERSRNAHVYQLHRDLLKLRRTDPVFSRPRPAGVDGAVLGPQAFVLRFFGEEALDRLLFVNCGKDLSVRLVSEPLLAPGPESQWELRWSSEAPQYGGAGTPPVRVDDGWRIAGQSAFVFAGKPELTSGNQP
jgi:maltooligosyltrehalose trehalohydrolase